MAAAIVNGKRLNPLAPVQVKAVVLLNMPKSTSIPGLVPVIAFQVS